MKKIIFDTDLGGDCDDVLALDVLLSCSRHKECDLIGITYSSDNEYAPACIRAICKEHGRTDIPVGKAIWRSDAKKHADNYSKPIADAFPCETASESAVSLLRKLLVQYEHVTLVVTGFLTNMAALLQSEGDDISPLNGCDLVAKHVDEIALMACNFQEETSEYNIYCDLPAAQYFFQHCPCLVTVSPFELGFGMITGKPMREYGAGKNPDAIAYTIYGAINGRDSWDPVTAYYAVYGTQELLQYSAFGRVDIDTKGISRFTQGSSGKHRLLLAAKPQPEIAEKIDACVIRLFENA